MTSQARSTLSLQVLLHDQLVGSLTHRGTPGGKASAKGSPLAVPSQGWLQFSYAPEWLERADAVPLSWHLPLQDKPFDHWASHAFFAGLLPAGALRQALSTELQIALDDDLALLEALGADCLGVVSLRKLQSGRKRYAMDLVSSLLPAASPAAPQLPLFDDSQTRDGQGDAAGQALLHACGELILGRPAEARSSWPASAAVVPIWQEDENGNAQDPNSSHVLWMAPGGQDAALLQRAVTMQLLQKMGVPVQAAQLMQSESITTLLQLRPDRRLEEDGSVTRIQTETLGQALGLAPGAATSRQASGWAASFALLREHAQPSVLPVLQLLDLVVGFVLVGDALASPHRLLLQRNEAGHWQLAPLWDVCSTLVSPGPHLAEPARMALAIGRHRSTGAPCDAAWDEFAQQCGLSPNQVRKRVRTLAQAMRTALPTVLEDEEHAPAWQHPSVSQLALHLRARADQMARSAG
ncbi:MAG: HipA N-terminal domain-containing protein [Brachymonas denitrificans]